MTKTYILRDILELSTDFIEKLGFENPRLEAQLLLSGFFKMKKLDLYLQFDRPIEKGELEEIRSLLQRRAKHEPLQYLLGTAEFYGLNFKVDKSVLIPRMDTEVIVEETLKYLKEKNEFVKILEIGTGSGCIAISLAKFYDNCKIDAVDISYKALLLARENAEINGVMGKVKFYEKDILASVKEIADIQKYDLIISNPPYISTSEMEKIDIEVKAYEPSIALTDKGDGLLFYKRFKEIMQLLLKKNGAFFTEIGYKQADSVLEIFKTCGNAEIIKDLSGNDRVVKVVKYA